MNENEWMPNGCVERQNCHEFETRWNCWLRHVVHIIFLLTSLRICVMRFRNPPNTRSMCFLRFVRIVPCCCGWQDCQFWFVPSSLSASSVRLSVSLKQFNISRCPLFSAHIILRLERWRVTRIGQHYSVYFHRRTPHILSTWRWWYLKHKKKTKYWSINEVPYGWRFFSSRLFYNEDDERAFSARLNNYTLWAWYMQRDT